MFSFKELEMETEWQDFRTKILGIYEEKVKPVLREPPTSDVTLMVKKLEFLAGWLPYFGEMRAKAEKYYKLARAEALVDCPYASPEFKVRVWLEGEIADVEYFYNHLSAIYTAATDAGMKIQTALRVEMELLGQTNSGGKR